MYCDACGAQLAENQKFCRACGKPVGDVPIAPPQSGIAGHVRLLGILWLAISALHVLPGIALMTVGHMRFMHFPPEARFVPHLLVLLSYLFLLGSIAGFAAGWGLLQRSSWARMLALVLGAISLLNVPFGTALGAYTLWVLLPEKSEQEYRRLSQPAS